MRPQRRIAFSIVFVLLASAIVLLVVVRLRTSAEVDPRRPVPPGTDVPVSEQANVNPGDDFFARLEKNEATIREEKSSLVATREGRTLRLKGLQKTTILTDCLDCGPEKDVEHYAVERFTDPTAILVYRQLYEGDGYVLITEEGTSHELPSYPVFSPDRSAFVVVSASEAFNWNGIELWERQGSNYVRKLHYEPSSYELYRFLGWTGNDRVRLEYSSYSEGTAGKPLCRAAEVRKKATSWNLEASSEVREGFCPFTDDWLPELLQR